MIELAAAPLPLGPVQLADPPSAPCSEATDTWPTEPGCGPRDLPPHWPGASLPPPHTHLQHGSRHHRSHVHLCFPPGLSPGRRQWPCPVGSSRGASHSAAEHLQKTCPAEELPSPAGEAAAGGLQAGSARTWFRIPASPFQVMRPRASLSASQSDRRPKIHKSIETGCCFLGKRMEGEELGLPLL